MGRIDRIDLFTYPDGSRSFRVIDYKSGACPTATDVKKGIYLQLPLYALAVESLLLSGQEAFALDVGYWGLNKQGFTVAMPLADNKQNPPAPRADRTESRDRFEEYLHALASHARQGHFRGFTARSGVRAIVRPGPGLPYSHDSSDRPRLERAAGSFGKSTTQP